MSGQEPNRPDNLPTTPNGWYGRRLKLSIGKSTLHSLPSVNSASKLTEEQFLCMRALWPRTIAGSNFPEFEKPTKDAVEAFMKNFPTFDAYIKGMNLDDVEETYSRREAMGAFMHVWLSKKAVEKGEGKERLESTSVSMELRSAGIQPRLAPNYREGSVATDASGSSHMSDITAAVDRDIIPGPTEDEQIVNNSLLLLLQTLVLYWPKLTCRWSAARSPFDKVEFGTNSLVARTDGYLEANGEVFAIIEVKPWNRGREKTPHIFWQETGEMIAWLTHDWKRERKSKVPRHLIISQDNCEIYLTIATFSEEYRVYLTTPSTRQPPRLPQSAFMMMQSYGPWQIGSDSNMKRLARIILSVALEVTEAAEAAKAAEAAEAAEATSDE